MDAEVLAISADDIDSHCRFADKLGGLEFPHLSDGGLTATRAYGVLNDRGTGCRRALFVVDRDGVLRLVNLGYNVSDEAQYQAVFDTLGRIS